MPLSLFLFFSFQIRLYSFPKMLPRWHSGKESACQCRRCKRRRDLGLIPSWRRKWACHSSILAWRILWTEEPGGTTVHGVAKSQTWLSTHASIDTLQRSSACSLLYHVSGFEFWVSSAGYECAQFSLKWNFPHFPCLSFHLHSFPPSISSTPSYRLVFNLCRSSFTEFTTESPPSGPALALQILKDI